MKNLPKLRIPKIKIKKPAIDYKKLAIRLTVFGILLVSVTGYVAYNKLYVTKERRFWMAIENSLTTQSVVRSVESGGTGNLTVEKTRFNFASEATVDRITSIGNKDATSQSNVTTENILTPTAQYVRYLDITTSEKKADGTDYNFDSIKGVWAKQAEATSPEELDRLKLSYVQPHVTVAPFGYLSSKDRNQIVKELKDSGAYDIDYVNTKKQIIDDHEYVVYAAKVRLKKYVTVLQNHFSKIGFGVFPPLKAENYAENARYNAQFLIDPRDNSIAGLKTDSQVENYSNYGAHVKANIPSETISIDDLQSKLQSLQ